MNIWSIYITIIYLDNWDDSYNSWTKYVTKYVGDKFVTKYVGDKCVTKYSPKLKTILMKALNVFSCIISATL